MGAQAKKKALDEIDSIHAQQRNEIKAAHNEDFQRFCREWEDNMTYYDQKADELKNSLLDRHKKELKALRIDVIKGMSAKKPKFSKFVLDNRVIEGTLARQGKFTEGQKFKSKRMEQEGLELEKMKADICRKVLKLEDTLRSKHEKEVASLNRRVESGRNEQNVRRDKALEKLLQRYKNVNRDLDAAQILEKGRVGKYVP